jgi:hypothetical protein
MVVITARAVTVTDSFIMPVPVVMALVIVIVVIAVVRRVLVTGMTTLGVGVRASHGRLPSEAVCL